MAGCRNGFSLIELIAALAIIGILAAILIPSLGSARASATKAKTRVQFGQWAVAIESFRGEYGYYPVFDPSNLVNPIGQSTDPAMPHRFYDVLAARHRDGTSLPALTSSTPATAAEAQNPKLIVFYSFSEIDLSGAEAAAPNLIHDGAENDEIAVLVDRNLDGVINSSDYGSDLPLVRGMRPNESDFPDSGIRAGVVFYAPAPAATSDNPSFVFSWK